MRGFGWRVQRCDNGAFVDQFTFETAPALASDIMVSNHYTETHPNSHFTQERYVGIFTEEGRIGLAGDRLTVRRGEEICEEIVPIGPDWLATIERRFGLNLERLPPEKLQRLLAPIAA